MLRTLAQNWWVFGARSRSSWASRAWRTGWSGRRESESGASRDGGARAESAGGE
jgi:hypothetical protein